MLIISITFFIVAVFFGITLLKEVLKNKKRQDVVRLLHGVFAGLALLLLIAYIASGHFSYGLLGCLAVLVLAAIGGFTLLMLDIYQKPIPKVAYLIHPLVAITGLVLLVWYFVSISQAG